MNDLQELRLKMLEMSQNKAPYEIDEIIAGAQKLFNFVQGSAVEHLAEEGTDTPPTALPETVANVDAHPEFNEAICSFLIDHFCRIKRLNNLNGVSGWSNNTITIDDKCFPKWFTDEERAAIIKIADDIFNKRECPKVSPPVVWEWERPHYTTFPFPKTNDGLSEVYAEKIKSDLLNEVTTEKYTKSFNEQEKRDKKNDILISKNNIQTAYTPELEKELRSYMAFRKDYIVTHPYDASGPKYLGLMRGSNHLTSSRFALIISGDDLDYVEVDSERFLNAVAAYCVKDSYSYEFFDKITTGTEVASISGLVNESQIKFTNE